MLDILCGLSDDRVEMRGDAHLHNTEILLGFLNTEELTNENDPRNQQGLVGGDKDAGTPIPQIERKIPGIQIVILKLILKVILKVILIAMNLF